MLSKMLLLCLRATVVSGFVMLVGRRDGNTTSTTDNSSAIVQASQDTFSRILPSTELEWQPCFSQFFCAVLDVPLDYRLPNGSRAFVPLIKYPSTQPSKGMLLTNPGGPGEAGTSFVIENASALADIVGHDWDIVSWDPRGIGSSMPALNCSIASNSTSTVQKRNFERRTDKLHGPSLPEQFFEEEFQYDQQLGVACQAVAGGPNDAGPHMNTIVVARDIISILDAYTRNCVEKTIQNPHLLNYWGFSYGTTIGQTFATAFPDRVGRMINDGVVEPDAKPVEFADEAFSTFFTYCYKAGPDTCPYYTGNSSHDIFLRFEETVRRLDPGLAFKNSWANTTMISIALNRLKIRLWGTSYAPASFPFISSPLILVETLSQNITEDGLKAVLQIVGEPTLAIFGEQLLGVACTDLENIWYNRTMNETIEELKPIRSQSFLAGDVYAAGLSGCAGWSIKPAERSLTKFGAKTRNPILFVSNTLDPVTPITSGKEAVRLFPGSQLLTIDMAGHSSLAANNTCANNKIRAYLHNGALPGRNNYCAGEVGPWGITLPHPSSESNKRDNEEWNKIQEGMGRLRGISET